ncbi:unnamed protein product [Lymnaea stagnalis]|uniref:DNA topoisomerase n=1 Tax=Lymnaea stagnalis TaxID=6523 RepID=A0AAV2I521_LYMST
MIFKFLWSRKFGTLTQKNIPGNIMRVLNVAEKNDAAKSLANVMSQGRSRMREGFSKFNKIYEFDYRLMNQEVKMVMTSVSGHLLGLEFTGSFKKWNACNPVDLFSVPVEKYCPPNYMDIKKTLEREIKNCQSLVIWTDCDREGENIGFEIIEVCQAVKPNIKVYRAKFSEITPQAVTRAVNNLVAPDVRINDAVNVRQELDLRIGAAFTRFQTLRLQKIFPEALAEQLVSYGSCQFPTLGFVVERYKQVQAFVPEPFWKLKVTHLHDDVKAEFCWKRNRLFDFVACQVLYDLCLGSPLATVVDVKSKSKNKWRPQALDTVELEKLGSRKLKINAKETMKIAEKLYTQGFISYPRTETNMFPKDMDLVSLVEEQTRDPDWGAFAQQVLNNGPNPRNGNKTDQAHPPIHPLKYTDNLQGNERKIYEYIVRHFLACLSQDAQGHETVVDIDIAGESFSAQGLMILARNYLEVYPYEKWNAKVIPLYRQGDQFEPNSIELIPGETSAPPLLTEADLISLMEKHGIGTDATHADHIETVKSRMYVGLRPDGRFVPGQLGMGLVEGYDSMGYEMSKPHLRAELEADLKLICEGRKSKEEVLQVQVQKYKEVFIEACRQAQKLDEALSHYLGEAQTITSASDVSPSVVMPCQKCGNPMTLRSKKDGKGFYIGCSGYPNCRASIWLPDFVQHVKTLDETCQVCGTGSVKKLLFKFKPGNVPMTMSNEYVGCVGGCDEMLNETLGIRPFMGGNQSQNDSTVMPRTEIVNHTPRQSDSTSGRPGNFGLNGSNARQSSAVGNKTQIKPNQSRNYHTSTPTITSDSFAGGSMMHQASFQGTNRITVTNRDPKVALSASAVCGFRNQQTPNSTRTGTNRIPLSTLDQGYNDTRSRPSSATSANVKRNSISEAGGDKTIVCSCGSDALLLTVRKEGPNTGRQFYKCPGLNGNNCNFFLWADDSVPLQQQSDSVTNFRAPNPSRANSFQSPQVQNRETNGSKNNFYSNGGDAEVQCKCGLPAKALTVQKLGPNTGRPFYSCSKPREQSCSFFQWADEMGSSDSTYRNQGGTNSFNSFQPKGAGTGKKRPASSDNDGPKQRKPPTCGYCGKPGHKKPKCPERSDGF